MGKPFTNPVFYVKIRSNAFEVKEAGSGNMPKSAKSREPFTTERLLIGEFMPAEVLLTQIVDDLMKGRLLSGKPVLVMHPLEKIEGGLSEVEDKVLRELAFSAGAKGVVIHIGSTLLDHEVVHKSKFS